MNKKQIEICEYLRENFRPEKELVPVVEVFTDPEEAAYVCQAEKAIPYAITILNLIGEKDRAEKITDYILDRMEKSITDLHTLMYLLKKMPMAVSEERNKERLFMIFKRIYTNQAPDFLLNRKLYEAVCEIFRIMGEVETSEEMHTIMGGVSYFVSI